MKTLKKYAKKYENDIYRIVIMAILISIIIPSAITCMKMSKVHLKLFIISDNITFIEETANKYYWTDDLHENYDKQIGLRNNLINSEDSIESFVASHGHLIRFITYMPLLVLFSLCCWVFFKIAYIEYLVLEKRIYRKLRKKYSQHK